MLFFLMKMCSVKRLIGEVADTHTGFLVVELVHSHVLFLDFDCAVIERVADVLTGGYGNDHFGRDDLPIHVTISGVMTCPFTRLVRFGVILKTLLIMLAIKCETK